MGGTEFRTSEKKQYVQSVAFAVYKKEVFEKAGLLDEQLIRNQDDEFHYRLNAMGFRILMVPELRCIYFVRDSITKLFSQYLQYGYYKPIVLKKVKTGLRIRHLIPAIFVLYIITLPLTVLITLWFLPLAVYTIGDIFFSFRNLNRVRVKIISLLVFPVLHISYGLGFLAGILKLFNR